MCRPISLIVTEDKIFLPPEKAWNHSHTFIMQVHNIPDGLIGDKYLRLEVVPPEENIFRNKETNKKLVVNNTWKVVVDETIIPEWYKNDLANQEDRVREAAKKWFDNFPDNLVPGYREIAGDFSKLTGGDSSTLTGGNSSTLIGGNYSKLTGGYGSTLNGGNFSTLTGGNSSTLTGGDSSTLTGGNYSKLNGGNYSKLNGGNYSTLNGGNYSTLTGGYNSTLTGGDNSTLTGGDNSTLTGGYYSTLTGGNGSTLTGGDGSVFCAGESSSFSSIYWDGKRYRTVTFYVGENGILPNKKYKISNGKIYDEETGKEVK
jgi:hypothetical protein